MINPITIYGAETDITDEFPTLTAVQALSGVVSATIPVRVINGEIRIDIETVKYLGGGAKSYKDKEIAFNIETLPLNFPLTTTNMSVLYSYLPLMKSYIFLDLNGYLVNVDGLTSGKTIKAEIVSYKINHSDGSKTLTMEFIQR